MRRTIATLVRRLGLSGLADSVRFRMHLIKNRSRLSEAKRRHAAVPLPPPYFIYETYRLDYDRYLATGKADAAWVIENASRHISLKEATILDWGCGPARVVRHLASRLPPGCRICGSDYNREYIDWCRKTFPQATFEINNLLPPLSFGENFFTVIYSISVFTHLSADAQIKWTTELARVLQPGGLLLITTHGDVTRENLSPAENARFDQGDIVVRGNVKEGHRMYAAYQPPHTMRSLFKPLFNILEHQPGKKETWGYSQDLWILQKK